MKTVKTMLALAAALAAMALAAGTFYSLDDASKTVTFAPSNSYSGGDRFCLYRGTLNFPRGVNFDCGGDSTSSCNFLGVDRVNAATINVNGGTIWCNKAKGAGYLKLSANNNNQTATLTINTGSVTVDTAIWTCTWWNSNNGSPGRGIININGGALTVGTLYMGADSASTGSTEIYHANGLLSAKSIDFRAYNTQTFQLKGGTVKALGPNIFYTMRPYSGSGTRTIELVSNTTSVFDNNGFAQELPPFTGTGTLRLMGTGAFSFPDSTLTYKLELAGTALTLGTATAAEPLLTVGGALAITGPTAVNLTLPTGATGRYPIFAGCGNPSPYAVEHLLTSPLGTFVLDNGTIYLDVGAAPTDGLVYSDAAGGNVTPELDSYLYAAFTPTAGAFTVGGSALGLSGSGIVLGTRSGAAQTVTSAITLATANAGIYTGAGSTLVLNGGLTGTTPTKDGPGTLVLGSTTVPATINVADGTIDLGGQTLNGTMPIFGANGYGRAITFKNGTLVQPNPLDIRCGYDVHFGEGFNLDLTGANSRLTVGWQNVWPQNESNLYLDPGCGTVTLRGNGGNWCNFITPDASATGRVIVNGGVLHALREGNSAGCLRIATGTNPMATGILKVAGGEVVVDWDLSMATVYNGLNGGAGTAEVDFESGTMRVSYFYLGGSSTAVGQGTIRLTGGDLYVKMLKCWGYCTQTLICDGARIHAVQDSYSGVPFLTAFASADSYPRSYTIGANGLLLDTAGYKVSCDIPFTGVGGITVTGAGGVLTNLVSAAYTGALTVTEGARVVYPAGIAPKAVTVTTNSFLQVTPQEAAPATLGTLTLTEGAKLVVDVSRVSSPTAEVATEGFVLPEGANILDFVEVKDDSAAVPRYATSLADDGQTIVLNFIDADEPFFADWTGRGVDPANVRDPANWACFNYQGESLEDVIPTGYTTVRLTGATQFNVPAAQALAVKAFSVTGATTLTGDCDWRGLGTLNVPQGQTIDLRGHKLYVSTMSGTGTITDSTIDYMPLASIESRSTEYIDTGYIHTAATRIVCEAEMRGVQPGTWAGAFGARDKDYMTSAFVFFVKSGKTGHGAAFNRTGEETTGDSLPYDTRITLTCTGREAFWTRADGIGGTGHISTYGRPDDGVNSLFIFNLNTGAGADSKKPDGSYCRMRLYSFKIYEGDELKRDFVPMRRLSTGEAGLWDRVGQNFYGNAGTGKLIGFAAGEDATAYGELHIDVPEGATYTHSTVTFNGALKVVKDGAGLLVMSKAGHGYSGGTRVAAGTLRGTPGAFGGYGTEVAVDAGTTFDVAGYGLIDYPFILNGGTLANTVKDVGSGYAQTPYIRLTADSFINAPFRMGLIGNAYTPTTLDLAGHTLTVDAPLDFYLCNTDIISTGGKPGTFKMLDGFLYINRESVRGATADFDLDCVCSVYVDIDMHDFTYRWTRAPRAGTSNAYGTFKARVFGTFTPLTKKFHNVEMQNGSTLNLAGETGVWSATSENVDNGVHKVTFATNAVVTVAMGSRPIPGDWTYVVDWGTAGEPENRKTLAFKAAGAHAQGAVMKADEIGVKIARFGLTVFVR